MKHNGVFDKFKISIESWEGEIFYKVHEDSFLCNTYETYYRIACTPAASRHLPYCRVPVLADILRATSLENILGEYLEFSPRKELILLSPVPPTTSIKLRYLNRNEFLSRIKQRLRQLQQWFLINIWVHMIHFTVLSIGKFSSRNAHHLDRLGRQYLFTFDYLLEYRFVNRFLFAYRNYGNLIL